MMIYIEKFMEFIQIVVLPKNSNFQNRTRRKLNLAIFFVIVLFFEVFFLLLGHCNKIPGRNVSGR